MAVMYPQRLLDTVKSPAEREVYPVLAMRLPNDFVVFHNVRWLAKSRAGGAFDGETDFLVAHPQYGILVIEVKGGTIRYDGTTDTWTSTDRHGVAHIIDPFRQALGAQYSLRDKLKDAPTTRPYAYPIGRAVWFPDVQLGRQDLALDIPREIVLDIKDLADPCAAMMQLYEFWMRPNMVQDFRGLHTPDGKPYGQAAVDALVLLLAPTFEIRTPLSTQFAREHEVTRQLTEQQFIVLDVLQSMRRACISGCAGSGKTFLAVEKARRLAREGYSVLLTCFNRNLAEWLRKLVPQSAQTTVCTFAWLCEDFAQRAGVHLPPQSQRNRPEYFDDVLPHALLDATDVLPDRFDAIVVDEGQDFDATWWVPLEAALRDPDDGILYVFYDDNQQLYSRIADLPIKTPPFPLTTNCRNTQAIHRVVAPLYRGTMQLSCRGEPGRDVEFVRVGSGESAATHTLRKVLHQLIAVEHVDPHDLVILTPIKKQSQWIEGMRLGNYTLTWQVQAPVRNAISCSTIYAFKGMEKPVVIVTELNMLRPEKADQLRYVAYSRATNHLVVIEQDPAAQTVAPDDVRGY